MTLLPLEVKATSEPSSVMPTAPAWADIVEES
jgi:hypothetical protein